MPFNSLVFVFFIGLFFLFWPLANRKNQARWIYLTISSLIFYAFWDWRFVFLILFSGLVDYFAAKWMTQFPQKRKILLILSLAINLGSLSVFKYTYFIIGVINDALEFFSLSFHVNDPSFHIILPVGISFYTFQSMSYTIDVYRNRINPASNIWHFFSYLVMFPQLVAGPIIRAKDLLHQLAQERKISSIQKYHAWKLIAYGLFQKTVIADNVGYLVDLVLSGNTIYSGTVLSWLALLCFSFQIYFDFSGYSLIARGIAKMMGYHFKMNFNHPYTAKSLREFWSRWHISLSTWFRDYVYKPLGGNRQGFIKAIMVMFVTMMLSGIWHGASYGFLIWAAIHGISIAIERLARKFHISSYPLISWILTMFVVMISWVFFRISDLATAVEFIRILFSPELDFSFINYFFNQEVFLVAAIVIEVIVLLKRRFVSVRRLLRHRALELFKVPVAFTACIFLRGPEQAFIYFQF